MRRNPGHPDDLLCERCGYALRGLDAEGVCPECGREIAASLPERRAGTAWQRRPSPGAWLRTGFGVLRRPVSIWPRVRIERGRSRALATLHALATGMLATAAPAAIVWRAGNTPQALWILLLGTALVGLFVFALTWIEWVGIRFFGARRGWRVTPDVAWAVCGHAAAGWVVGGMLMLIGWLVGATLWTVYPTTVGVRPNVVAVWVIPSPPGLVLLGAALAGMVVFESIVYAGFLRCRYANTPRATLEDAGEDEASTGRLSDDEAA